MKEAAGDEYCQGCRAQLFGTAIGGLCARCLLSQPPANTWATPKPPSLKDVINLLPRFDFRSELGTGATGTVFLATDTHLGRPVAVKVVSQHPDNPEYGLRFSREACVMAGLKHPNIVTVHDYGAQGDLLYMVMELVGGGTLASELAANGKLHPNRATTICEQLCDAVKYAHAQKIIHRDIKPGNILLDLDGTIKLTDFGLVSGILPAEHHGQTLTRTGVAIGTPHYMAPEQAKAPSTADHRADIYSIGTVFYEMLTGTTTEGRSQRVSRTKGVPRALDKVIDRALQIHPENRFENARSLRHALRRSYRWRSRKIAIGLVFASVAGLFAGGTPALPQLKNNLLPHRALAIDSPDPFSFGTFQDEIDLRDWQAVAHYDFEDRTSRDISGNNPALTLYGGAVLTGGVLITNGIEDSASVELRYPQVNKARDLAVLFRFRTNPVPSPQTGTLLLLDFQKSWNLGVFIANENNRNDESTFLMGARGGLKNSRFVKPDLYFRKWHEVWMVLDSESYRVWLDGKPSYQEEGDFALAAQGTYSLETASLTIGHFDGVIDHVQVWERE